MAHDVFISYAHTDKPTADAVCATLEGRGIRCWMAPRDVLPGVIYSAAIVEAIRASRVFVLVFSAEANISPHVMRELERAVHAELAVLPLRIEDVPLSPSMEYFISTPHWLDALTPPLEKHLEHLADTVKLLLEKADADRAAAPKPATSAAFAAPAPALEPIGVQIEPPAAEPASTEPGEIPTTPREPVPEVVSPVWPSRPTTTSAVETAPAARAVSGPRSTDGSAVLPPGGQRDSVPPVRAIGAVAGLLAVSMVVFLVASTMGKPGSGAAPTGTNDAAVGPSATVSRSPSPVATTAPSPTARAASWLFVDDKPHRRSSATAVRLASGSVLVAGGDLDGFALGSAELFDPLAGTWTDTASMATARLGHTMTLLPDGRVLVAGGMSAATDISSTNKPLASAELYDPATGKWTATGSMAARRTEHTATLLADGTVLVAGGFQSDGGPQDTAEIYDPAKGTWRATGAMHQARWEFAAVRLADGRVLAAGSGGATTSLRQAEIYDPRTRRWTNTGSMKTGRARVTLMLLDDGRVLVTGGTLNMESGEDTAASELFDPATGTWSATAAMASPRSGFAAALLSDGTVLVAGGDHGEQALATCERFDPSTETWIAAPPMGKERGGDFTATLLNDGRVLVVGGGESAELFDPGSPAG